ncbi:MAG: LCP family protein [Acidimicrobiia bacterium]
MGKGGRFVGVVVAALAVVVPAGCARPRPAPAAVIGVPEGTSTSTPGPRILTPSTVSPAAGSRPPADQFVDGVADVRSRAEPRSGSGMIPPDGAPPAAAIPFTSREPVPDHLVFILVAGSDARPREDLFRTRADSLHLLAVNPASGQGTVLGFPRDSWVEIPGHGRGKINNALALGGPDLLAATVRRLTGLPVDYYVLTGFSGFTKMVDELGGVDVLVERRMNDKASGARFERGWHKMSGPEALAFTRNRNDVANGDFSRSENQGLVMLAALAKMRAEVADDNGIARWLGVLVNYVRLDVPRDRLPGLAALARRLDPAGLRNVVAPGRVGSAGGQSVVYLTTAAARLFEDLRADAVVGGPSTASAPEPGSDPAPEPASSPSPAPETSTTTAPGRASTTTAPAEESTTTSTRRLPGFFDDPNG